MVNQRLPFSDQVDQLRRQLQWLIDLERLLDPSPLPDQPLATSQSVAEAVDRYLNDLLSRMEAEGTEEDQTVATHIDQTLRNHWWGLFQCYDVEGLPRTNNELERFLRRIKTGQRRVSGHKNVQDFIIRYGAYAACIDYQETLDALLERLQNVSQQDFLKERRGLNATLLREQKRHRFRHRRMAYLQALEERWETAVNQPDCER